MHRVSTSRETMQPKFPIDRCCERLEVVTGPVAGGRPRGGIVLVNVKAEKHR
jgi:hypothetical protein